MICQVCGRIYLDGSAWICSRCRRHTAESELRVIKRYTAPERRRPVDQRRPRIRELARIF